MSDQDNAAKRAAYERLSSYFLPGGCGTPESLLVAEEAIYRADGPELRELLTGLGRAVQGGEGIWELRRRGVELLRERSGGP